MILMTHVEMSARGGGEIRIKSITYVVERCMRLYGYIGFEETCLVAVFERPRAGNIGNSGHHLL